MIANDGRQVLGAAELGKLLGVSRQRVSQLTAKEWFPAPVSRLSMGPVWELVDIERMVSGTDRTLDHAALEAHLTVLEERHRTGEDTTSEVVKPVVGLTPFRGHRVKRR